MPVSGRSGEQTADMDKYVEVAKELLLVAAGYGVTFTLMVGGEDDYVTADQMRGATDQVVPSFVRYARRETDVKPRVLAAWYRDAADLLSAIADDLEALRDAG